MGNAHAGLPYISMILVPMYNVAHTNKSPFYIIFGDCKIMLYDLKYLVVVWVHQGISRRALKGATYDPGH
jgi:hypothetical protein